MNNETILTHERCDATQLDRVYFHRVLSEQAHQMTWWTSVESRSRRFLHSAATPPCTSAGTVTPASVWRTLSAPLTTPFLATFSASSRTAMVGRNYGSCSPIFVYFSTKLSRYVEDYFFRVWKICLYVAYFVRNVFMLLKKVSLWNSQSHFNCMINVWYFLISAW